MSFDKYRDYASLTATRYGIPVEIFHRLIRQESSWNPGAVSKAGAIGLGQLMPGTARDLGVDPHDPVQNLDGAGRYLSQQYKRFKNWDQALAAYNFGPENVNQNRSPSSWPVETQNYVKAINGASEAPAPAPLPFSNASAMGNGPQSYAPFPAMGAPPVPPRSTTAGAQKEQEQPAPTLMGVLQGQDTLPELFRGAKDKKDPNAMPKPRSRPDSSAWTGHAGFGIEAGMGASKPTIVDPNKEVSNLISIIAQMKQLGGQQSRRRVI